MTAPAPETERCACGRPRGDFLHDPACKGVRPHAFTAEPGRAPAPPLGCTTCGHTKSAHDGPGGVADCGECGCRDYAPQPSGELTEQQITALVLQSGLPTDSQDELLAHDATLRVLLDELHDQRHAEARKADALAAALAAAEGSEALWHRIADERSAEIERLSGELAREREGRDKIEAEVEVELERATFQKFRDESYAREAKAGLIRTEFEAMLNRIASTVSDYFEPRNEECVADGVDGLMDDRDAEKARADEALAEVERLRRIVEEVAASGVEFDDDRCRYVAVQIDRNLWDEMKAKARARAKETP